MAAPTANRIPAGILKRAKFLTCSNKYLLGSSVDGSIAASQTDQVVGRIVLPFPCQIIRIDYSCVLAGSTHTLANIEAKVDGTAITSAYTAANSTTAAMEPTSQLKQYDQGAVLTVEADTDANSTISEFVVTATVLPLTGDGA